MSCQYISQINYDIFSFESPRMLFREIWIKTQIFSCKEIPVHIINGWWCIAFMLLLLFVPHFNGGKLMKLHFVIETGNLNVINHPFDSIAPIIILLVIIFKWFTLFRIVILLNRPVAQIPQSNSPKCHNAPFWNRNVHMCAYYCYKMVHCGIFVQCIVAFVRSVQL